MDNEQLIEILNKCAATCSYCAAACLGEDDVKMMTDCIRLDMDCADICRTTVGLLARGSKHGKHLLKECIEICDLCAAECAKHAGKMDHCRECAEVCRDCRAACEDFAKEKNDDPTPQPGVDFPK